MKPTIKLTQVTMDELEAILNRAKATIGEEDYEKLKAVVDSCAYLTDLVEDKDTTSKRLRQMLFGSSTEKTVAVIKKTEEEGESESPPATDDDARAPPEKTDEEDSETKQKRKGHGRNGADAYRGAEKIRVPHESLQPGDACPECKKGKVYEVKKPGVLVRIVGQAPVHARVYQLRKLRCNLCGKVFTAQKPEGVGSEKYDATSASMIALLKYGSGLPFNRLEGLQGNLGIPLPAWTQWDIVNDSAKMIEPVYDELIRQAAQGEVLHNDDTPMKILELMGKRAKAKALAEGEDEGAPERAKNAPKRRGVFTSGIVSTSEGRTIALFFTGRRHAGENLAEVLRHRAADLSAPIQMCDALSRNEPKEFETILANCNAHGRRQFVDVADNFPDECRYALETLGEVYKNDGVARERNLSSDVDTGEAVDLRDLRVGDQILLSVPDNEPVLLARRVNAGCTCVWSVEPELTGSFDPVDACETVYTVEKPGDAVINVTHTCNGQSVQLFNGISPHYSGFPLFTTSLWDELRLLKDLSQDKEVVKKAPA